MTVVPVYAGILAFLYIYLAVRVIQARGAARVAIGSGGNATLERLQRVHANFAEYVPLALILLTFVELQGWPGWLVHLLCVALVAARIVHAYGVSQEKEDFRLRTFGVVVTFGVLALAAAILIIGGLARVAGV